MTTIVPTQPAGGWLRDRTLVTLADAVDDLEGIRKATAQRIQILTAPATADDDGVVRGHGLIGSPAVASLEITLETLKAEEARAVRSLEKAMKAHPLGAHVLATRGVGLKGAARLLSAIGDPYWNDLHDRPRRVSELWAFCGLHVIDGAAARRKKGQVSNWSTTAKTRGFVIAEAAMKGTGPYRDLYVAEVSRYTDVEHPDGLEGNWCQKGDDAPIRHAQRHARGVRRVEKAILKDLWRASRDLYRAAGWDVSDTDVITSAPLAVAA